ncbi:acyl-CoA synthetase [Rhodococcus triatomae]|uniref:Fatty-acyl-CoA synthase n=1 Tax=Rhodococcus triatomae TaxID=300028 RepID=A0A1G8QLS3_9NOCA|nr:acyl-CoA synthetase [Rhodococcus triatomae]QNG20633.1 acyl-CoA synthetase [Rhodococcus triatomae]QNG23449.1 acyl-CoA synthetase [Rhodococcus triatomae]SDJ05616.1 fatty-acyl-CoA synthase [Rhodococcus triatomae]
MYPGVHARRTPDKPAVIEAHTGRIVTYAELEAGSIRFAHWLRAQGWGSGDHLAVLSTNDATVYELYWGAVRSGMYVTLVNTHLTAAEIAYIVDDCGAEALVVSATLADLAPEIAPHIPKVRSRLAFGGPVPGHLDYHTETAAEPATEPADQPRGTDMLYSSGTTGKPKGIKPALSGLQVGASPGPHVTEMMKHRYGFGSDTVYMSPAPVYHAAPLRYGAGTLALGGTVVMLDHFDAERSLAAIEKYEVTHSQWVPTHFVRMLRLPDDTRSRYDVSSMRVAVHAAAPCPVDVKHAMLSWWGPVIYEYYSSTESCGATYISPDEWQRKPGSVGHNGPESSGTVHICDDAGTELPRGEVGLIYFERDDYTFEYHNDPGKTAEARHPTRDTWTTTGDLGYLDEDDYLFLTDRAKFTIISGGVNIYPQEVENVLSFHPKIHDVAVVGTPDPEMGQLVTAVVHPADGVAVTDELAGELIEFCRGRIAHYKCPRSVRFVDSLPRTATGKLVKGALLTEASSGAGR